VERSKGGGESHTWLSPGDMSATERTVAPIRRRHHHSGSSQWMH
jgi:hypothetical protein